MSIYNRSGTDLIGPYTHGDGGPSPAPRPPATRDMTIIMYSAGRIPKKMGDGDGKGDVLVRGRCILFKFTQLDFEAVFFYLGEISPNFNLEKMISTYTRNFPWKKWPKFARFPKKEFQIARFYAKFQQVAKNIEGFCVFSTFISRM
jgi:hypothetical protein